MKTGSKAGSRKVRGGIAPPLTFILFSHDEYMAELLTARYGRNGFSKNFVTNKNLISVGFLYCAEIVKTKAIDIALEGQKIEEPWRPLGLQGILTSKISVQGESVTYTFPQGKVTWRISAKLAAKLQNVGVISPTFEKIGDIPSNIAAAILQDKITTFKAATCRLLAEDSTEVSVLRRFAFTACRTLCRGEVVAQGINKPLDKTFDLFWACPERAEKLKYELFLKD